MNPAVGYVLSFGGGVLASYVLVRIFAPTISIRIANGIADEIVTLQRRNVGIALMSREEAFANIGVPMALRVTQELGIQ